MDGVRIALNNTGTAVVILDAISDEIKTYLRDRLAAFCYGAVQSSEDDDFYSFENTIAQFLERYETKPATIKLGMAGEFVVHTFMPAAHSDLTSSAIFFNKEERHIKKGFDLTFLRVNSDSIWYGEVKSGQVVEPQTADEKARLLLKTAASDLNLKLGAGAQRSRWESALIDAQLTLQSEQAFSARELLRSDVAAISVGEALHKSVVLGAAVMHHMEHCEVSLDSALAVASEIREGGRFSQVRVIVVQQSQIEAIIDFLREVASA